MTIRWITVFVDRPAGTHEQATRFWQQVTGSSLSSVRGDDGEFATLLPATGDAYLRIQRTATTAGQHLDLHVDPSTGDPATVALEATGLGARVRHQEDGLVVLDSPGGYPFCLVGWDGETTVPAPLEPDPGGRNRLDQLCLDIPPDLHESERAFWAALTGWRLRPTDQPEFGYLEPNGMPVRLLFQRRDQAGPGERVHSHLDFAAADAAALAERHAGAGATLIREFPHWITLADPSGLPYCLTRRDPG